VKALVTGAAGMLARALVPALERAGHTVVAPPEAECDVTDFDALAKAARAARPDWVFHLAAYTKVDDCESQADRAHLVNGLGAKNAALAAAEVGAAVLGVSTDYVFGGAGTRPFREHDPAAPRSVYGASKWAGEQAVREVNPRHLVVRTAWLYGAGGPNFPDAILARARSGQPLQVVDDQRGSPTWTEDLAPALVALAESAQYGTYHCTSEGDCTWHEFAVHLVKAAGLAIDVARTDSASFGRPAPRPAYSVLDNGWFRHVTGRRMPHWREAADRYLASVAP
jgi:dTDP-4-dehydrorhamnose reductase